MTTILLTAIGGDVAQSTAQAIRLGRPDVALVGTDIQPRHAGTLFVDHYAELPRADAPDYVDRLAALCARHAVDAVLPMSEVELARLVDARLPCSVLSPGREAIAVGSDKLTTIDMVADLGWTVPVTGLSADAGAWSAFPCIFKLRRGSGSKVVELCCTTAELRFFAARYPDGLIQKQLTGEEITCAIFRTRAGDTHVLQLERRLIKGMTWWARTIHNDRVEGLCRAIAERLDVQGAINVQLMLTHEGPRIFEINPRISSTVLMRHLLGFEDACWTIDELVGTPVNPVPIPVGRVVVRTNGGAVLPAPCPHP